MSSRPDAPPLLVRLAALNDAARLRLLRLLERQELSVGELARALQLPQSTVSRHLKLLHDGGWIVKRSAGTASLYCLVADALDAPSRELWTVTRGQLDDSATHAEDDARLAEVIAERRADSRAFFGRIGGDWDRLRHELFGEAFTLEALLGFLPDDWVLADLGCGTGNAAACLAPFVGRVVAIDREPAMLEAARRRLGTFDNVEFRQGELGDLPLADGEIDAALVVLVMHHLEDPAAAVREIARALRPGGVLVVVDMVAHDRESYRHTMGHVHLGFDEPTVAGWATAGGLASPRYRRLRPDTHARGPGLFVASMTKP